MTNDICIRAVSPTAPAALELIAALDAYQLPLYPPETVHLTSPEAMARADGAFLGVFAGARLVACGGFVNHNGGYGEVLRMFVRPEARGVGIGRKLLEAIEAYALAAGLLVLRLETGVAQPGAVRLYERAGYSVCEPFGAFAPQPTSIYMEKRLDAGRRQPG